MGESKYNLVNFKNWLGEVKPVSLAEFNTFWRALSDTEKEEYTRVAEKASGLKIINELVIVS